MATTATEIILKNMHRVQFYSRKKLNIELFIYYKIEKKNFKFKFCNKIGNV